ncbi:Predicted dehydrogenase [Granulicella pectinivorans]|uniref:Predicted dehydrogenase n=1 Tax=Granulicella pectinivorans TaxID=474950 RepID=A0A1I6MNK6_9BACT|nr:Gfo/Idh/MocA family oxidoreductase [Granulicella pectinivorans]SFS17187.1 Predicted dehydrogenase [Granulicella pectinivorans]
MSLKPDRRSFLVGGGLTALASARAFGASDTLRVGIIGAGGRMNQLMASADVAGGYEIVAVSDVYGPHAEAVKARSKGVATTHVDYREVLDNKGIDAVIIAAPDHWHVKIATDAIAAGKDVYLEKPVTHTLEEGAPLIHAVRSSKQILQCGMQQRSWSHFRNAVDLIQGGSLGHITQVRTYWWQNYGRSWVPKPLDMSQLNWKRWLGSAPQQEFTLEKYFRWRWFWNFGGGAMTDLFTHWIDVVHWAMKEDVPSTALMLGDKYVYEGWDCPDTIQAAFRYPGFDVVYEGMMSSSIDDGGLEFRGTTGTLKLSRSGFSLYREAVKSDVNPVLSEKSFEDGTNAHMANFFECIKTRKDPHAPVETGVAAARAGHIGNMAYKNGGKTTWPAKS